MNAISHIERNKKIVTMNATFKDEEKCQVAMETIVKNAHAAYGVNSHFWFRSKDGKSLYVLEQYEDEKALRLALMRLTSARISFARSINVIDVTVYGSVKSNRNKMLFSLLRPQFKVYYGGFSKLLEKSEEGGIKRHERDRVIVTKNVSYKDGDKCKAEMEALVEEAYQETGTLTHLWCKSREGKDLFVHEIYADEQALTEHLRANPTANTSYLDSMEVSDVIIYGAESDKVKEMYASLNPTYMTYYGGYSK